MGDDLDVPTCVLKVNIQCCAVCPMKVKKKLQKINGVYAVDIDTKNGLVSVQGIVQPSTLIQILSEKFGKKVELYAYEKNPKIQSETLARKCEEENQTCSFTDEASDHNQAARNEVEGSIPEEPDGTLSWHHPQSGMKKKHGFAGWFGKKSTFERILFGNFGGRLPGYARLPPPPPPPLLTSPPPPLLTSPPPLPPLSYRDVHYPPAAAVYPSSPPCRITKPPRPYPYDFYEKKEPPIGNSAFHSFRDDNVNACSIM